MTADDLARFRAALPGCELVVFADIRTGTVLAWNGALKYPQEHLDTLSAQAAAAFSAGLGGVSAQVETAVLVRPSGVRAFLRTPDEPGEALCCVFPPSLPVEDALRACRALLAGERDPMRKGQG